MTKEQIAALGKITPTADLPWEEWKAGIAAMPELLDERNKLIEALQAAVRTCNCMSASTEEWHSPRCHIPLCKSVLRQCEGEA